MLAHNLSSIKSLKITCNPITAALLYHFHYFEANRSNSEQEDQIIARNEDRLVDYLRDQRKTIYDCYSLFIMIVIASPSKNSVWLRIFEPTNRLRLFYSNLQTNDSLFEPTIPSFRCCFFYFIYFTRKNVLLRSSDLQVPQENILEMLPFFLCNHKTFVSRTRHMRIVIIIHRASQSLISSSPSTVCLPFVAESIFLLLLCSRFFFYLYLSFPFLSYSSFFSFSLLPFICFMRVRKKIKRN